MSLTLFYQREHMSENNLPKVISSTMQQSFVYEVPGSLILIPGIKSPQKGKQINV